MIASINIEIMNRKFLKIRFSFNFYFHILNLFFISTCLLWTSSINNFVELYKPIESVLFIADQNFSCVSADK